MAKVTAIEKTRHCRNSRKMIPAVCDINEFIFNFTNIQGFFVYFSVAIQDSNLIIF